MEKILVGDIGGTNVRFALASTIDGELTLERHQNYPVRQFTEFDAAVSEYLLTLDAQPERTVFAFAGPKFDDEIKMTNTNWIISEAKLAAKFGFKRVEIINDFEGLARGAAIISSTGLSAIIDGAFDRNRNIAVLGPGTGLGLACILPDDGTGQRIMATEGGHLGLSPQSELERDVMAILARQFDYVSSELILCGSGFYRLYLALCEIWDVAPECENEAQIIPAGRAYPLSAARRCIDVYCDMLGVYAGSAALALGASGGVMIGGGVSAHIHPFLAKSDFSKRFKARGSASQFLKHTPVKIITQDYTAQYGAAALGLMI